MKYIIVGIGNFGGYLAKRLTNLGHEVIGVDTSESRIEMIKDSITHSIVMDATDQAAVKNLPLKDTDVVIIAIGEDIGASIMSTAIFKQLKSKRIIARAINDLHETVIQAIGVDEIIHPEEETADRLSKRLEMKGVLDSLEISDEYNIVEVKVPKRYLEMTVAEADIRKEYYLNILTVIKIEQKKNLLGINTPHKNVIGVVTPDYKFAPEDILLLFGKIKNIQDFLHLGD
ncbi:potassium channel family protein [Algoriphagus aquimarinus]|uniref:Trk system potassium uptake protein TrkA n=1 Tax=Algoriphagus aquimarinus TaxID=237018 RepID=A0A1I0VL19_9BACT|nr:TrkA family potassium uptake protein [Algoriphagus aquimarinus]SFA77032.1 trk system potassium uptake protein TrkA [Algoriphagus aquimarinus]|tara:strand:- start:310952 stop:311641 length:690 start_codon:yes stop_codon:yes gene_type:complete